MVNDDAGGTNIKTPDVLKGIGDVSEAFAPYVSLIGTIALTTEETLKILENVEYNKKTCKNLIDRIQAVEFSIKLLVRRREENEKKFRDEVYYKAFYRLVLNLEEIKNFVRDVSRLSGLRKFIDSGAVKKKFKELINEYDQAIIALHFTKCIADEEQREQDFKDLDDDMNEMTKFLEVIEAGVTDNNKKINDVLEQISLMWQDLLDKLDENARPKPTETSNNNKEEEEVCVPKIEQIVLTDVPFAHKEGDTVRGKVYKKYCRDFGIYVACKGDKSLDKKEKEFPRYIAFLKKISKECNYIIKFYGVSTINGNNVMVMDWAAYGNLRDFYIHNEIKWAKKLEIVLDICRGITFLHAVNYLHHDIRCENILLGNNYSPKITNFKLSRRDDQVDKSVELGLQLMLNIINWMAPEKLKNQKNPYTKQCEIFSFGMLMWELAFERKPYEGWGMEKIKKHVIENGREMVHFKKPENKESQDKYVEIMKEAWSGDPTCRPTFQKIVLDLNNLITIEKEKTRIDNSPWLRPRKGSEVKQPPVSKADQVYSSNLFSSSSVKPACSSKLQSTMTETKKLQNIPTILTGISQHKKGHREKALEIFTEHVKLNNKTAKFWYGYYLLEGYAGLEKNRKEATKYFREAAEEGVPDAQLRYAHILLDDSKDLKNGPDPGTLEQILCYFTLAADNKNASARYLLGSLYYHGKHGVKQDKEKGLHYIKLAAIQKHHKAIALLKELKEDPYQ